MDASCGAAGSVCLHLTAQVLSQFRPAGGALIDDRLVGAQGAVSFSAIFFVLGMKDQAAHLHYSVPVVLVEVGGAVFKPVWRQRPETDRSGSRP